MRTAQRLLARLAFACLAAWAVLPGASVAEPASDESAASAKTLADGLYLNGYSATFGPNYSTVTVTVNNINNDSYTRTTGTLKIEYWAALAAPARGASFTGYRLATFSSIAALAPRTYYSNVVRSSNMTVPPDGTYWFVLILLEYDPAHCSAADGFCMVDNLVGSQRTFGNPPPSAYRLTVSSSGSGSVTSNPAGISCGSTCSATFSAGSSVTLSATPGAGNVFSGWSGACSGTAGCTVTMNGDVTVGAAFSPVTTGAANYSDIWWNPNESGWGLTIADHQTQMFAVWYTYRQDGSPTWFVIPGGAFSQDRRIFSGDIYQTTGPSYTASFDSSLVRATRVGSATLDFSNPALASGTALFSYNVGSISQSRQIQRQSFGDASSSWGSDLTDIYWDPAESGWGLTVSQHGNNAFVVWYTYDTSGQPLFVVMPGGTFSDSMTFTGDLYTTTGPYFGGGSFDPSQVRVNNVGTATLEFDLSATAAAAGDLKAGGIACRRGIMGCQGRLKGRLNGASFGKWISPQGFGYSAPDTPPPACEILYTAWSACAGGVETRSERTRNPAGCSATPELARSCTNPPNPQACTYTYTAYGACQPGNYQSRTVISSTPPGCTGTPVLTQSCTYAPQCVYQYSPFGACVGGVQSRTVISATPAGCVGTPSLTQSCSGNLPPGFPTNIPLGTYRLDIQVCATLVGCISSSQFLTNTDAQIFASQVTSVLQSSALGSQGCAQSTSFTPFNGTSFTATLYTTCTSGSASASSTVTIRITKV